MPQFKFQNKSLLFVFLLFSPIPFPHSCFECYLGAEYPPTKMNLLLLKVLLFGPCTPFFLIYFTSLNKHLVSSYLKEGFLAQHKERYFIFATFYYCWWKRQQPHQKHVHIYHPLRTPPYILTVIVYLCHLFDFVRFLLLFIFVSLSLSPLSHPLSFDGMWYLQNK